MNATAADAPRRRTRAPEERRAALLDAAEQVFLAKGFGATSIDDIVAAADVAKGTFYLYFESKEVLLVALRERFIALFVGALQQAMDRHRADNLRGRLRTWVEAAVDTFLDHVALHDVVFHEFRHADHRLERGNPVVDQLAGLLARGHAAEAWQAEDPHLFAVLVFHALHGALDDVAAHGTRADRPRLKRQLAGFFERGLALR